MGSPGAGPIFQQVNKAADNLTDTTAYVEAVLGDPDEAVGAVLPPGPSGLDNVDTEANAAASAAASAKANVKTDKEQQAQDGKGH